MPVAGIVKFKELFSNGSLFKIKDMSYTLAIIILIGIPVLIYFLVSIKRKKKNEEKQGKEGSSYQEGKAKDTKFK